MVKLLKYQQSVFYIKNIFLIKCGIFFLFKMSSFPRSIFPAKNALTLMNNSIQNSNPNGTKFQCFHLIESKECYRKIHYCAQFNMKCNYFYELQFIDKGHYRRGGSQLLFNGFIPKHYMSMFD